MLENAKNRKRFSIGNSVEEIEELVKKLSLPVLLIPFGEGDAEKILIAVGYTPRPETGEEGPIHIVERIRTWDELDREAPGMIKQGFLGLVHVLKPVGKYPDEQ